jgi:two-component system sensor kinase FixL
VLFICAYVFLSWLARYYLVRPFAIVAWNPSAGLGFALLLIGGLRWWPALAVATALTNLVVRGVPPSPYMQLLGPLIITACYVGMTAFLRGPVGFSKGLERSRDLCLLLAVAVVGTLAMALAFVGIYRIADLNAAQQFGRLVLRFWVGHLIGIVTITPLALVLTNWDRVKQTLLERSYGEIAAQAGAIVLSLWIVFWSGQSDPYKLFYLLFLPLIWIVMRHAMVGAAIGIAAIQFGMITALIWTGYQAGMSVAEFQFMTFGLAASGLALGMVVTEHRTALGALAHSESRLRAVVTTAPDGIITVDHRGAIVGANPAAERIFAYSNSPLIGVPVQDVLPDFDRAALVGDVFEVAAVRGDGSTIPVELSVGSAGEGAAALRIGAMRDISRRKQMERDLADKQAALNRSSKLAAAGEMAAALAHELHQPLSAIRNYGRAMKLIRAGNSNDDLTAKIEVEAARAANVVQGLRDFFCEGRSRLEAVSVRDLIEQAVAPLCESAIEHDVLIELGAMPGEVELLIDRVQCETVLHTLISNAIDAIATGGGSERVVQVSAIVTDNAWVQISVSDSGPGINPAIAARLFEPFATTKPKGIGLGLAMSRSMVEGHGGSLWAESERGRPTVFHFTLPRTDYERTQS